MSTGNPNIPGPGPNRVPDDTRGWGCGWAALWLLIIIVIFVGWGGWYGGWRGPWGWWGPPRQVLPPPATAPPVTAPQTATPPPASPAAEEFLGRTVTLSGRVDQVFSPQAFTLAGSQGGQQLLVLSKNPKTPTVKKGETVQVTGSVEKYEADELNKTPGVDVSKVPAANFTGRPAVVASSVSAKPSPG